MAADSAVREVLASSVLRRRKWAENFINRVRRPDRKAVLGSVGEVAASLDLRAVPAELAPAAHAAGVQVDLGIAVRGAKDLRIP